MTDSPMTPLERVLTTLGHEEPDRVPFFLLLTMHGAKELGTSIEDYFSKAENVVEGQLALQKKYKHDCIYNFFYAPIEVEAWGGDVIYSEDGPPNSGEPVIKTFKDIYSLTVPDVKNAKCLNKVLRATELLKAEVGDSLPIIGVAMSPFSMPVMQMGFPKYIDLMYNEPEYFEHLMKLNENFCVNWANAQLEAGATAICYFDPVSSPTIVPKDMYVKAGCEIAKRTLSRINGPTATHLASGNSLPIIDNLSETGTAAIATSVFEDLSDVKQVCREKLTVIGNLNAAEMRNWTAEKAEQEVKDAIKKAAPGGGFILSDNHGEIPWQTPDHVLHAISDAVHEWGTYPIAIC